MSQVYFLSDLHHAHENLAKANGFNSSMERDLLIKTNWNNIVTKKDLVIIPGDITHEKNNYSFLEELNGQKTVILGNHDLPQHTSELMKYVNKVAGFLEYKGFAITHCPIHESEIHRFRGNIHGHLHDNVIDHPKYFNVCCERTNYTPISFTNILKIMNKL